MPAVTRKAFILSIAQEIKKAYEAMLADLILRVNVYVVDKDGNRVGETVKVGETGTVGVTGTESERLSHGGNHVVVEVFITAPEGLSAADATGAQQAIAQLPVNIGAEPAFASLLSVAGITAAELTATPAVQDVYTVSASPPPPCSMQCTQLMNGLSKRDPDMCVQYGGYSMGNPADLKCYPYGYNGCDSGMTHCNQKVCARKDKKPSKCQKKLVKKGKISKCSKRKWGQKKCKKTCCEAGY